MILVVQVVRWVLPDHFLRLVQLRLVLHRVQECLKVLVDLMAQLVQLVLGRQVHLLARLDQEVPWVHLGQEDPVGHSRLEFQRLPHRLGVQILRADLDHRRIL